MWLIDFCEYGVDIEEYKRYATFFVIYEDDLAFNEWIWVEDSFMGVDYGWWILGVGLNYPPWNINHMIEGEFS